MFVLLGLAASLTFGFITISIANAKNRSNGWWFWAGFLLGIVGLIWIAALPAVAPAQPAVKSTTKATPLGRQYRSDAWLAEHPEA